MLLINSEARTTSRPDVLTDGTYVVLGLVMHTMKFKDDRTLTQPVPLVGRLNEAGTGIASVHLVLRSDLGRRLNNVKRASNGEELNNTGTFVAEVHKLTSNTPVGVHPDIYYCLKIFSEIRNTVFKTTDTPVSCLSATGRAYTAHVYTHKTVGKNGSFVSSDAKRKAIQALATDRGFGEVYGLDNKFEFADENKPNDKLSIDDATFTPVTTA